MITLRSEQIQLFDELAERLFVKRMLEHVQIHFPDKIEQVSESIIRDRVVAQIARAKSLGFVAKPDVCDFISLCWQFGDDFDNQYKTKWAGDILNDTSINDPGHKIAKLNDKANQVLNP